MVGESCKTNLHECESCNRENKTLIGRNKRDKNNGKQETGHRRQTDLKIWSVSILVSGNLSLKGRVIKPKTMEDTLFFVCSLNRNNILSKRITSGVLLIQV